MSFGFSFGPVWYHPTIRSRAKGKGEGGREGREEGRGREGKGGIERVK